MALVRDIDFDTQTAEVLRVEEEFELALVGVGVVDRGGPLPTSPGRTRWVFLKDLPRGLLPGGQDARPQEEKRGLGLEREERVEREEEEEEEEVDLEEEKVEEGRGQQCLQHPRRAEKQPQQQRDASPSVVEADAERTRGGVPQEKEVANGDQRPASGESSQATQPHHHSRQPVSAAKGHEIAGSIGVDGRPRREVPASETTQAEQTRSADTPRSSKINNTSSNGKFNDKNVGNSDDVNKEDVGSNGNNDGNDRSTAGKTSSAAARLDDGDRPPPTLPPPAGPPPPPPPPPGSAARACSRYMLEVKPSTCGEGGGGRAEGSSAGLGVFCNRAVAAGEVVFDEEALFKVSRKEANPRVWADVRGLARNMRISGSLAMDMMQAVAFDAAPPSVKLSVLRLFAPEEAAFPRERRQTSDSIIRALDRFGVLPPLDPAGGSALDGGGRRGARNGGGEGGARTGDGGGRSEAERRAAVLSKGMMICDANIFGEDDDLADGPRALFELACRINHSCLPNCGYDVRDGRIVVRASVDLAPGAELLVSYLSFEDIAQPTPQRRQFLRESKFFECHCSRCDAPHDVWRGFRCPRCHEGVVHASSGNITGQEQRAQGAQRRAALSSSSSESDTRGSGGGGGGGALLALGVSACTDCGRVPTARWLKSAEALEGKFRSWLYGSCETMELPDGLGVLKQAYAVGVYLFADHYLLCAVHRQMAEFLRFVQCSTKAGGPTSAEIAYHLHQMLAGYDSMFGRPTEEAASKFQDLATTLFHASFEAPASEAVRNGRATPPPSAGDGSTSYASLVLTPVPRRATRGSKWSYVEATATATRSAPSQSPSPSSSSSLLASDSAGLRSSEAAAADDEGDLDGGGGGGGECSVCGRRHGDPTRPVLGHPAPRKGQQERRAMGSQHRGLAASVGDGCKIVTGRELEEEKEEAQGREENGGVVSKDGDGGGDRRLSAWPTERRVYQEDCQRLMVRAVELAAALYGPEGERVAECRQVLEGMQELLASGSRAP